MNRLCFFEIPADDLEALMKFYSDMFGWTFDAVPGKFRYYSITQGNTSIKGGMTARQDPAHTPVNYVAVESVEAATEKAVGLGAKVVVSKDSVPGAGWYVVVLDPQGNRLGFWQDDPNAV
ncbi:MAG: VOC family protein [Desulfomonilaceae bacterium]|nr:VOC family protein [Desulfomonilaceae bacterium]